MKTKIFILLTGAFIATAYLAGCGGGGNNNNAVAANCQAFGQGTAQYNACIANPTLYSSSTVCQTPQIANNPTTYQQCLANPSIYASCGISTGGYQTPYAGAYGGNYAPYGASYPNQNLGGAGCPIPGFTGGAGFQSPYYGGQTPYYGQSAYYSQPVILPVYPISRPYNYNPWNQNSAQFSISYSNWGY
jgi:hypothetical protein